MAVYEEQEAQQRGVADTSLTSNPDLHQAELSVFQPITGGEIEVNSSALKSSKFVYTLITHIEFYNFLKRHKKTSYTFSDSRVKTL